MTHHGSFFPLGALSPTAEPVLFAFVVDTPQQREALHEELMARINAIQQLSETLAVSKIEAPHGHSHAGILDAVAILSRDVRGLIEAGAQSGP